MQISLILNLKELSAFTFEWKNILSGRMFGSLTLLQRAVEKDDSIKMAMNNLFLYSRGSQLKNETTVVLITFMEDC